MAKAALVVAFCFAACAGTPKASEIEQAELVVYGGTSAGVVAAVQAARLGRDVVLVAPTGRLGGLSSAGLGATDTGNREAIGGMAREFYGRLREHYRDSASWTHERAEDFPQRAFDDDAAWRFEPCVAERVFGEMVEAAGVRLVLGERLDLERGVERTGLAIASIRMESGRRFRAPMFVDATYEGDLMAQAGVDYTVGREAGAQYGESLNGVQHENAVHHQFEFDVDPYVVAGDASSGLLPGLLAEPPGPEGSADAGVQAYNFRLCLTKVEANQIPFAKPDGYDERDFELLLRNFEAGDTRVPWHCVAMPNGKTDTNNNKAFSTDYIGANHDWPQANYAEREEIRAEHERYQRGLLWTLANHPRVPQSVRDEVSRWGLARDEFVETNGWPHQIYVREARRMVSDYVMTQADCQGERSADDSIGLGAYAMDSHNVWRYVDAEGHVRNEGDVQVKPSGPYCISYRSIVPKRGQCENLYVPCAVSASHIAYGSIRMEPVFMVLAQSAAIAADMALDQGIRTQEVDARRLRERLLAAGQRLDWPVQGD